MQATAQARGKLFPQTNKAAKPSRQCAGRTWFMLVVSNAVFTWYVKSQPVQIQSWPQFSKRQLAGHQAKSGEVLIDQAYRNSK